MDPVFTKEVLPLLNTSLTIPVTALTSVYLKHKAHLQYQNILSAWRPEILQQNEVDTSGRKNPKAPPCVRFLLCPIHTTLCWLSYREMLTARRLIHSQSHITGVEPPSVCPSSRVGLSAVMSHSF